MSDSMTERETRCDTCKTSNHEVEQVPLCEGRTANVCRDCLSHLADFVTRIGML